LKRGAERAAELEGGQGPRVTLQGLQTFVDIRLRKRITQARGAYQGGHAAGLIHQMAYSHPGGGLRVGHPKPGQVTLNRGVQLDPASFDELHHCQRSERLGRGAEDERRLGCGRFAAGVRPAIPALVRDPIAFDNRQRKARNPKA